MAGLGLLRLVVELEVLKKDLPELFGRGKVEGGAGVLLDRGGQRIDLELQLVSDELE